MSKKSKAPQKSLVLYILPAVIMVYLCVVLIQQQFTINQLSDNKSAIESAIQDQEVIKQQIDNDMQSESKLQRYEVIAREKLGYMKKNERLFVDSSR